MIYLLLGTGFEETEAVAPLDLLRRAGAQVQTVGLNGKTITGSHGIPVVADITIEELDFDAMEAIILPGGLGGVASIRSCPRALEAIRAAAGKGLVTAAICAGPTVLADLGLTEGKRAVCYPGCEDVMDGAIMLDSAAVVDGTLITGASAGCAIPFGLELVAALVSPEAAVTVARQIVIR